MAFKRSSSLANRLVPFILLSCAAHTALILGVRREDVDSDRYSLKQVVRVAVIEKETIPVEEVTKENPVADEARTAVETVSPIEIPPEPKEDRIESTDATPVITTSAESVKTDSEHEPEIAERVEVTREEETETVGNDTSIRAFALSVEDPGMNTVTRADEFYERTEIDDGANGFVPCDNLSEASRLAKPEYPELARRWGHEGTVLLRIDIRADGSVGEVTVLHSSGYRELDDAACDTVLRRWRFCARDNEVYTIKEFVFSLRR